MAQLFILGVWAMGIVGWILNIWRLTGCDFHNIGAEVVLRIVGIPIAILGAVLGYIGHF